MKRHALFVGVNKYDDKTIRDLKFSIPDASVLADRFKGLGYKTRLLPDPTGAELKKAVIDESEGLGHGDVFLFFFAGHGFTAQDGSHLLFCRDDIQCLLRRNAAGVKVDALEELTSDRGFHRAFLLDSCRTDCFAGIEGRGSGTTRDLDFVAMPECTKESGSYFLLRSCDKFRPSLEFDEIGHGLFTQGLLDAMAAHDSRLAFCDTSFAEAIRVKMAEIQRTYNVTDPQRPSLGDCSGPQFSLFDKGVHVSAVPVATQSKHLVVCPSCGFRNVEEETFRCRVCGRDHLCHRHYDEVENCCADCALKCKAEREEAQRKRRVQNNEQYGRTSIGVTEKFSVVIRGFGVNKPSVLKELQKFYRVSLSEIKRSFQSVPAIVMRSVSKDDAERCKFQLENVGADVAIGHDGFFDEMLHGTKKRKLFDNEAVYIITVSAVLLGGTYVLAKLLVWWLLK